MSDFSLAHRAALAQLIETVSDRTLRQLVQAVGGMPGERARILDAMLADVVQDRARRTMGMGALSPMFHPRADGVGAANFPPQVLRRLWKIAAEGQAAVLIYLDPQDDDYGDTSRIGNVCSRLYASAAAAVRDQPDTVWPSELSDAEWREPGLDVLARVCDLGGLAHRALPSLGDWVGRPSPDQLVEFRLFLRDASAISEHGAQELLEILFAHLTEAPMILRLVANSSHSPVHEDFLSGSELAVFVDRLIDAAEVRVERLAAYRPGEPIEPMRADLEWISGLLNEIDATLPVSAETVWGQRLRAVRLGAARTLSRLLGRVNKAVDRMLPTARVQTVGRMRRELPRLDLPVEPSALFEAQSALDVLRVTRGLTRPFGCEGQRQELVTALTAELIAYADHALEEINAGCVADEALASERVVMVADFLERIDALPDARAVRRRVAVAGVPAYSASPRAA